MKKRYSILFVIFCMIMSGAAGIGGALLASGYIGAGPTIDEQAILYERLNTPELDTEALNAYIDAYLASREAAELRAALDAGAVADAPDSVSDGGDEPGMEAAAVVPRTSLTTAEIAALASDSVVEIYTESIVSGGRMGQYISEGAGSGVIITTDGYIVTNNHVIEGSRRITVQLNNGTEYSAALIGRDDETDLAVVKVDATGLQAAVFGDSDTLVVGETAIAIGNPLGILGGTVSEGIISALSRQIDIDGHMMDLLQTTAAVNPGNSGGGLFNDRAQLIGVVNAKSGGSDIEGIGFAIPINIVRSITGDLIEHGYVLGRIDFGATLIDILNSRTAMMYRVQRLGVYVLQADAGSPLQSGDRIVSINGMDISSEADVRVILDEHSVGDVLSVTVARGGYAVSVDLTLKQAQA